MAYTILAPQKYSGLNLKGTARIGDRFENLHFTNTIFHAGVERHRSIVRAAEGRRRRGPRIHYLEGSFPRKQWLHTDARAI